jgi:DNA topoisomerase-1
MKHVLQTLQHNGIYVPQYDFKGFSIKIHGETIKLTPKSEQMAVAWIKSASRSSPPDKVFMKNFMREFLEQLKKENNPTVRFLDAFSQKYLQKIENTADDIGNPDAAIHADIDFSQIANFVAAEKQKKEEMTKEEKKQLAAERKVKREELKAKYAVAEVDGQKLEIANWTAEPSCLFAGRGDHATGRWKDGPSEEDIILNLPKDVPVPAGNWKAVVWEPQKMYVAKWEDKLTGKIKYVWFSDTAFLKQNREKEKFQKAETLGKQIKIIEDHIMRNLDAKDENRRKVPRFAG